MISPGNITPSPTLSAIQKLTPEAESNYYHTVQSGETFFWIAGLYDVSPADLMTWNGLNATSDIRPEQKLRLLVTPPATATAARTQIPSPLPSTPFPSPTVSTPPTGTPLVTESPSSRGVSLTMIMVGGLLWWRFLRKSSGAEDQDVEN